jgi:hypothetical protein
MLAAEREDEEETSLEEGSVTASGPPRSRALPHAACTTLPTLTMVIEPPCTGALGSPVAPSMNVTRSIGRPRASAATCVMDVQVLGPIDVLRGLEYCAAPAALPTIFFPGGRVEDIDGRLGLSLYLSPRATRRRRA